MWKKAAMAISSAAAIVTMSACGGASAGSSSGTPAAAVPEGKVHCGILFRHRPYEAGG